MPIEYVLARAKAGHVGEVEGTWSERPGGRYDQGVVIVSEFVSCARVMRGALVLNPWRLDEVRAAYDLGMVRSLM